MESKFDLNSSLKESQKDVETFLAKCTSEELVLFARQAEQAERYDDMALAMKLKIKNDAKVSADCRNLLSVAYKNMVGAKRSSWRVISTIEAKADCPRRRELCITARLKVEKELQSICDEVLGLLEDHLLKTCSSTDAKVFYLKMKGDYLRYIAEYKEGVGENERNTLDRSKEREETICKSEDAYKEATELVENALPSNHPGRLGLALNFSVFYYEIKKAPEQAREHARKAFNQAIEETDMNEEDYKDSSLIMQLLRDNLTLWTSDAADENCGGAEDN